VGKYPSSYEWWIGLRRDKNNTDIWIWPDGSIRNETKPFMYVLQFLVIVFIRFAYKCSFSLYLPFRVLLYLIVDVLNCCCFNMLLLLFVLDGLLQNE